MSRNSMTTSKVPLVYWDSCIFIDALQQTPEWKDVLKALAEAARAGRFQILTSTLTLCEVIHAERLDDNADEKTIAELFQNPYITVRVLDRHIASDARRIAREHGLKPPDAVHVATALRAGVSVLHTRDGLTKKRGLLKKNGQIGSPPLRIEVPSLAVQASLDLLGASETTPESGA
jgi:predicted nucleic acid-binding protein